MTPTTLDLYMVSRLTPLATALEVAILLGFFATIASLVVWIISMAEGLGPDTVSRNLRRLVLTAIVLIVAGILRVLVPTTGEALAMIVIPKAAADAAARSQCLKDLAPEAVEAAKAWLDSVAKESK